MLLRPVCALTALLLTYPLAAAVPPEAAKPSGGRPSSPREKKADAKPNRGNAPVNIIAVGNRLIISSDDPEALRLAQELVRLFTQVKPNGPGDFEIIRLKNADAAEAAKILDEAYNGPRQQTATAAAMAFQPNFGRFGGRGGPAMPTPATPPPEPRIRVVADSTSNSLLVRASPLDMLSIRRLIEQAIDTEDSESRALARTWIIPLEYASVTEVAPILQDVYRDAITGTSSATTTTTATNTRGRQRGRGNNPTTTPRPQLSIGADERSNKLIVHCSEVLYDDIKRLTKELDNSAKEATNTIRVVPIKGMDPTLVQAAVDAMQGRPVSRPGTPGTPGASPFGGFGGGMRSQAPGGTRSFGAPSFGGFGGNGASSRSFGGMSFGGGGRGGFPGR